MSDRPAGIRFLAALPAILWRPIDAERARRAVRTRVERRGADVLELARRVGLGAAGQSVSVRRASDSLTKAIRHAGSGHTEGGARQGTHAAGAPRAAGRGHRMLGFDQGTHRYHEGLQARVEGAVRMTAEDGDAGSTHRGCRPRGLAAGRFRELRPCFDDPADEASVAASP